VRWPSGTPRQNKEPRAPPRGNARASEESNGNGVTTTAGIGLLGRVDGPVVRHFRVVPTCGGLADWGGGSPSCPLAPQFGDWKCLDGFGEQVKTCSGLNEMLMHMTGLNSSKHKHKSLCEFT
jgi:hypothetical protein